MYFRELNGGVVYTISFTQWWNLLSFIAHPANLQNIFEYVNFILWYQYLLNCHVNFFKPGNTGNIFLKLQLAINTALLCCKLKCVVARITTHIKHCYRTKFYCCKLKQNVATSWTAVYLFQNIFSNLQYVMYVGACIVRATMLS